MKIIDVCKWEEKNIKEIVENIKKEEEGFHIFITIQFISEKNTKRNWGSFTSCKTSFKRRWRRYWTLMIKKKYVWFINRKKSKRKNEKKYKEKQGKGFSDRFKLLY